MGAWVGGSGSEWAQGWVAQGLDGRMGGFAFGECGGIASVRLDDWHAPPY